METGPTLSNPVSAPAMSAPQVAVTAIPTPVAAVVEPVAPAPLVLPPPEVTHADLCADMDLFWRCLRGLWAKLGIADKVPRVGGRELDLYMLYCNVTSLGGCERVISRKQWRDAAESFQFPDTITSVSFSLRKAYVNFLWDFEQVYYFRHSGPRVPPPVQQKESTGRREGGEGSMEGASTGRKRKQPSDVVATTFPGLPSGTPIQLTAFSRGGGSPDASLVGSRGSVGVDARFDAGYFVTVKLGRHEFKGALYFPPEEATVPQLGYSPGRMATPGLRLGTGGGRGKRDEAMAHNGDASLRLKDPLAPKPNKTPFNFFSVDARIKAKQAFPDLSQTDITKKVGEMWHSANDEEKAPYLAMSNQDKARYQAEVEAYNYKLAAQAASSQAEHAASAVVAAQQAMAQQPLMVAGEVYGMGLSAAHAEAANEAAAGQSSGP